MNIATRRAGGLAALAPALASALASALMLGGCSRVEGGSTAALPAQPLPGLDAITAVPMGDLAGAAQIAAPIANPYRNEPQAAHQGEALFIKMNCAGCHGYGAGGGMGPNLKDGYWRYGGTPVAVFKSIYDGRAQGMPAWSRALPPQEIWKIVAYIDTLGGMYRPSQYQASIQGDRPGEQVAPEAQATLPPAADASAPQPTEGTPQAAPPKSDVAAPGGSK